MRYFPAGLFIGIILCSVVTETQEKPAPPLPSETKQLSEITKLKLENHQLKIALTQCQVNLMDRESKLASANLSNDRSQLEIQINKELGCTKFDWTTLKCAK